MQISKISHTLKNISSPVSELGPIQPPIQQVPGALSSGVKRQGCEVDYSSPSCAEVKNVWRYTSTLPYVFITWCLVQHGTHLYVMGLSEA